LVHLSLLWVYQYPSQPANAGNPNLVTVPRAIAARLTDETAAQQSRAALYQSCGFGLVDGADH
jgi:hypothetical protein